MDKDFRQDNTGVIVGGPLHGQRRAVREGETYFQVAAAPVPTRPLTEETAAEYASVVAFTYSLRVVRTDEGAVSFWIPAETSYHDTLLSLLSATALPSTITRTGSFLTASVAPPREEIAYVCSVMQRRLAETPEFAAAVHFEVNPDSRPGMVEVTASLGVVPSIGERTVVDDLVAETLENEYALLARIRGAKPAA